MKATCPNDPNHNRFLTTAHVMEEWKVDSEGNFISHLSWGNPTENDWLPWVVQIGVDEFILVYQHAVGVSDIGEDFVEHKPRIGYFHADDMTLTDWHLYDHQHLWGYITDFEQTPDGGFVVLWKSRN